MVAVSTNLKLVERFGIDPRNAFGFWDWVGGRYSVTSAVGMVPLSLQYGFDTMEKFLQGSKQTISLIALVVGSCRTVRPCQLWSHAHSMPM